MKLLLAIDGSPFSAPPVHALASRPWPQDSVVRIVTVMDVPVPVASEVATVALSEALAALRTQAEATLRNARETVMKSGLPVESSIREGNAGREIVAEAKEWRADLVLMGSRGHTGLTRVLMGSVAQYVVAHAPCSVEVVRATEPETEVARSPSERTPTARF